MGDFENREYDNKGHLISYTSNGTKFTDYDQIAKNLGMDKKSSSHSDSSYSSSAGTGGAVAPMWAVHIIVFMVVIGFCTLLAVVFWLFFNPIFAGIATVILVALVSIVIYCILTNLKE